MCIHWICAFQELNHNWLVNNLCKSYYNRAYLAPTCPPPPPPPPLSFSRAVSESQGYLNTNLECVPDGNATSPAKSLWNKRMFNRKVRGRQLWWLTRSEPFSSQHKSDTDILCEMLYCYKKGDTCGFVTVSTCVCMCVCGSTCSAVFVGTGVKRFIVRTCWPI